MNCLHRSFVTLVVLATGVAGEAGAQSYNIRHDFDLRLNARPNQTYRGIWDWYTKARAVSHVDGTDEEFSAGGFGWLPPHSDLQSKLAVRTGAGALATAQVNALANGTGFHQISGDVSVTALAGQSARSTTRSFLALNLGTINRRGAIIWRPNWFVDSISRSASKAIDPIDFSILDWDTGITQTPRLWDTELDFDGGGSSSWQNGNLNINGATGSFFLNMDSPFITSAKGRMSLTFVNGIVTASDDQGLFDGLLPAVGASSFGINIPVGDSNGDIDIDFDFGPDNVNGFDIGVQFDASGDIEATPEPATFLALGAGALTILRRRRRKI